MCGEAGCWGREKERKRERECVWGSVVCMGVFLCGGVDESDSLSSDRAGGEA